MTVRRHAPRQDDDSPEAQSSGNLAPADLLAEIESAESWTTVFDGKLYDDARRVRGVWFYCMGAREYRQFEDHSEVYPIFKNTSFKNTAA